MTAVVNERVVSEKSVELKAETIALVDDLGKTHSEYTGVRKNMQVKFIKMFTHAICDVGGIHWHDADSDEIEQYFTDAKKLVWRHLHKHHDFERGLYDSYFSTMKKCLHYEIDDWAFCKRTSQQLFEEALQNIKENENDDGTFYRERVSYQDAVIKEVKRIKREHEDSEDEEEVTFIKSGVNLRFPRRNVMNDKEYRNAILKFFRQALTHPKVESVTEGTDYQAKALRDILGVAQKNITEKKKAAV